jgi:hypothetical protein
LDKKVYFSITGYDDNGVAQALNVGPRGIRLNADKIDINGNREISYRL